MVTDNGLRTMSTALPEADPEPFSALPVLCILVGSFHLEILSMLSPGESELQDSSAARLRIPTVWFKFYKSLPRQPPPGLTRPAWGIL